jgi:ubiquinone/menaquinone biosynthesis C-methylase UbiE
MNRSHKEEKLAKLYDAEILPVWSRQFGRLLLRDLALPPKAMVLDVACGTGYPALDILRKMDADGRIIAIDASPAMLDEARVKAGRLSGKRIFFRSEAATPRLTFADDVYDLVVCNASLHEVDDPETAIREFARVAKAGGRVAVTTPLAGTFSEFHDLFTEVLSKLDRHDALERLEAYLAEAPPLEQVEAWFEDAGLVDIKSEYDTFTLLFKSSREFFFAPVIEYGPLARWKAIAGRGQQMQDVFWHAKTAIDAYFAGRPFAVTVHAGFVRGRKATAAEARLQPSPAGAASDDEDEAPTGEVELVTGDFDVIAEEQKERERAQIDGIDEDESEEPIL